MPFSFSIIDLIVVGVVIITYVLWATVGIGNFFVAIGFSVIPVILISVAYLVADRVSDENAVAKWIIFALLAMAIGYIYRPVL